MTKQPSEPKQIQENWLSEGKLEIKEGINYMEQC